MRRYSPTTSRSFSSSAANSLSSFALWTAFPPADYYEDSVPLPKHGRTTLLPFAGASHRHEGNSKAVPTFTTHRLTGWGPAFPLPPCCGYAAVLPHGLETATRFGSRVIHIGTQCGCTRLASPYRPGLSWWFSLEGVPPLVQIDLPLPVLLAEPEPSGSAGPSRRCRGCSCPVRRLSNQAASSFADLLRQTVRGFLPPTR